MWRIGRGEPEPLNIPKQPPVATSLVFTEVTVFAIDRTIDESSAGGYHTRYHYCKTFYKSCKDAFEAGAKTVNKDSLLECGGHYFTIVENKVREVEFGIEYLTGSSRNY